MYIYIFFNKFKEKSGRTYILNFYLFFQFLSFHTCKHLLFEFLRIDGFYTPHLYLCDWADDSLFSKLSDFVLF